MNDINDFLNNETAEDNISFDKFKYIFKENSSAETNGINRFLTDNPENKTISIEELKDLFKAPPQHKEKYEVNTPVVNVESSSAPENFENKKTEEKTDTSISSEDLYRPSSNSYTAKNKTAQFGIFDFLVFFSVLIVCSSSFFWFVTPITQIGGKTYLGKTLNLYEFIYGNENSLYKQILTSVNNINADLSGAASVIKIVRLTFYAVPTIIVSIAIIVNVISAIVGLSKKDYVLLRRTAVNSITSKIPVYVFFAFFGNISGGAGEDSYYIGYSIGTGMTIGILIMLALLIIMLISEILKNKSKLTQKERNSWGQYFCIGIFNTAILIVLTFIKLYSISVYLIESGLTSIVSLIQNFNFETFIFPALNLIIFYACINIYKRSTRSFSLSFNYLLKGDFKQTLNLNLKHNKTFKKSFFNFYPLIVLSLLSVISVFILSKTKYGLGWQGDIYTELVIIFALSLIGQSAMGFINRNSKKV